MKRTNFDRWTCPTQKAVEQIGDKWTLFVVRELTFGEPRAGFNQLLRALKPISSRTLALKLKKLLSQKVVSRTVKNLKPLKVEYSLTQKGKELKPTLTALASWHKRFS